VIDPSDWLDAPKALLLGLLRLLWWLAVDLCIETIAWSVGWCVLRVLTLGRYPGERLGEFDAASGGTALLVVLVGFGTLALGIWGLAGAWPG
jgi:hypothetical protein